MTDRVKTQSISFLVLVGLMSWAFWPELQKIVSRGLSDSEWVHILLLPFAIVFIFYLNRDHLLPKITMGSKWGLLPIFMGVILYALCEWPFSYGIVQDYMILPVLIGLSWLIFGKQFTIKIMPLFLLVFISIPIGSRIWATLIIYPETLTLSLTSYMMDLLPGVETTLSGTDITLRLSQGEKIIAIGESNRGAKLFMASGFIALFVLYSSRCSLARKVIVFILLIPVVLISNFIRFLLWGILLAYTPLDYLSSAPRTITGIFALLFVYMVVCFLCAVKLNLFVEDSDDEQTSNEV